MAMIALQFGLFNAPPLPYFLLYFLLYFLPYRARMQRTKERAYLKCGYKRIVSAAVEARQTANDTKKQYDTAADYAKFLYGLNTIQRAAGGIDALTSPHHRKSLLV